MALKDRFPALRKTSDFFNTFFDFGTTGIRNTFWPIAGGQSRPPINSSLAGTGAIITPQSALMLSAVWACVWLIADSLSTLPFVLNKRKGGEFGEPAVDDPLFTVLGVSPNATMTACDFWEVMIASELLWGNGYAAITRNVLGDVIALDPLRPEYMIPYKTKGGELRYSYVRPQEQQDYSADNILHLRDRTLDGLVGLSRIEFAKNSFGIAQGAETATSQSYKNGLRAGGFLTASNFLKVDQREMLRTNLAKFVNEGEQAGGLMILEGGLGFTQLSMKPADVELLASRQFNVEDICRWFGVPPVLIGHASSGQTMWGTGIEQILLGWLSLNLRPYVRKTEARVCKALIRPADQKSLYLTIDTDDLLGADSAARAALYSTYSQNGIMTRNEIRAREDLAPLPGGDVLTAQTNLAPLDQLGATAAAGAVGAIRSNVRAFLGIDDAKGKAA